MKQWISDFLSWKWVEVVLYWLIYSGGVISGLILLLASIWMSVNSTVHMLTKSIFGETGTVTISNWAITGYVALPELILALAFVTTLSHFEKYRYDKTLVAELIWAILFALPTIVFLILTLVTLGNAVLSTAYRQDSWLVVFRAIAGFDYAFTSLLYHYIGKPRAVQELRNRDTIIAELTQNLADTIKEWEQKLADSTREQERKLADTIKEWSQKLATNEREAQSSLNQTERDLVAQLRAKNEQIELLQANHRNEIARLEEGKERETRMLEEAKEQERANYRNEIVRLEQAKERETRMLKEAKEQETNIYKNQLEAANAERMRLQTQVNMSDEEALQAMSSEVKDWLNNGNKSATVDEIRRVTGLNTRRINNAIAKKELRTAPNNQDLVLKSSLFEWMKKQNVPALRVVNE